MSENTVRKYVYQLADRGLIYAEPTQVTDRYGRARNGNLCYTSRPIQEVLARRKDAL